MDTKVVLNVSDGCDVANGIDLYVNSFGCPSEHFYNAMLEKSVRVQHNFTLLCVEWFRELAAVSYYDERNEASIEFARNIPFEVKYFDLPRRELLELGIPKQYEFDFRNDFSASDLIERYLRLNNNNEKFISKLLESHATIQQNFSRLCCEWLRRISNVFIVDEPYVTLAKTVVAHYKGFPKI